MGLEQRVDKLEQSIGTHDGLGCDRCRDEVYLPEAVNTEDVYFFHGPCKKCGRVTTGCFRVVYAGDEALAAAGEGVR
jgi:hypothetical protein